MKYFRMVMRKNFFRLMVGVIICLAPLVWGEEHFSDIIYEEAEKVGPAIQWQRASSEDPRWEINIIRVDLSDQNVLLRPAYQEREEYFFRTSTIASRADAIAAVNGSFFGISESRDHYGKSMEYCRIDGASVSPNRRGSSRPTFGITHERNFHYSDITEDQEFVEPDWNGILHALAGNPLLVKEGEAVSGLDDETRHPRTMLGWNETDQEVTLVTVDGRQEQSVGMTFSEQARLLLDLGCEYGINYDGGGSTTAWIDGEVVNSPSDNNERGTVTAWLVLPANVVDHTDNGCVVVGDWSVTEEGDVYNKSSLTAQGGDDSMSVIWIPSLQEKGRYRVSVWYDAREDRTDSALYAVHALDDTHEISLNQQEDGGQWVELGEFPFDEGTGDFVRLVNTASEEETISADAVKFHYLEEIEE